jgi:hypothetical protein
LFEEILAGDYYRLLGVQRTATSAEIREAYIELVKKHHPDRLGAYPEPAAWQAANTKLAELNEAFNVLGDPDRRKEYDDGHTPETAPPRPDVPNPSDRVYMVVLGSTMQDRAAVIKALQADRVITGYHSYISNCILCTSRNTAVEISNSIIKRCAPKGGAVFLVTGVTGEWWGRLPRPAWEFLEKSFAAGQGKKK